MVFNPDIGTGGVPDFTGASRGTGVNRSFEALFGGLAETAQQAIQVKDTQTQIEIQDQAQTMFEGVNEEFGLAAPPAGMQNELDRVVSLQNALEQGKISETNYYGRLATLSKQMRSQYPGYEEIVDKTIQSVTGTRPANAFRDAIFAEMRSISDSASDEERFRRQYVKENEGIISALGIDPMTADFDQTRQQVAKFKGQAETIDAEMKQLGLEARRGELNDKKAERVMSQFMTFTAEAELNKAVGANGENFQEVLETFMEGGAQDLDGFTLQIGQVETQLRAALMKAGQEQFVGPGIATQDVLNRAVDAAMYPVTEAKKAILGGDFKYAGRMATINKNISDRSLNDILRASPEARVGAGLSELNQAFGAEYLNTQMANKSFDVDNLAKEITGRAIAGGAPNIIRDTIQSGDQQVSRATIDQTIDALKQTTITPERVTNIVDQVFGPNAIDFMSPDVVAAEDLEAIYTKFLDPSITKAIVERGTPEDLQKYTAWALEKIQAIPAFRAIAGDARTIAALDQANVVYNPETNRIDIVAERQGEEGTRTPYDMLIDSGFKPYRRAVNAANKVLSILDPIAEANGTSGPDMMQDALTNLGIDLDGGRDGFFKRVSDAIEQSKVGEVAPESETSAVVPEEEYQATELDFMFEEEEYDPENLDDVQLASYAPTPDARPAALGAIEDMASGGRTSREGTGRSGLGLQALVASSARGYNPDLKNLKPQLASAVQQLQTSWGKTLPIVSGYRDPARNKRAGGAKKSQHMHGNAVDIDVRDLSREERVELIKMARAQGFGGVGVYANSLHFDIGNKRAWGPSYSMKSLPAWAKAAGL